MRTGDLGDRNPQAKLALQVEAELTVHLGQ